MCTASWKNADNQMPRSTKLHVSMFQLTENVDKTINSTLKYMYTMFYRSIYVKITSCIILGLVTLIVLNKPSVFNDFVDSVNC